MKIFVGIRHFSDNRNKQLIEDISNLLNKKGFHAVSVVRDIEKWGNIALSPQELMSKAFEEIELCDMVVIEFSEKGIGLGIEAGYAVARHKPIIAIARQQSESSKSLEGISKFVFFYHSLNELDTYFDELKNRLTNKHFL